MAVINSATAGVKLGALTVNKIMVGINLVWTGYVDPLAQVIAMFATGDPGMVYVPDVPWQLVERRNLLTWSEFSKGLTTGPAYAGLVSVTAFPGFDNGIAYGHNGTATSYCYLGAVVANSLTVLSFYIKMDDGGGAPVVGIGAACDFRIVVGNNLQDTVAITDLGDGLYRVITAATVTGTNVNNTGVVKYSNNSARTFKVSGLQAEKGTVATAYQKVTDWNTEYAAATALTATMWQDAAGAVPVTAVEQVIGLHLDRKHALVRGASTPVSGWFNYADSWGVFSDAGTGFTATKTVASGNAFAISDNTFPVVLGKTYEVRVEITTAIPLNVGFNFSGNARSTMGSIPAGFSGTFTCKIVPNVGTASYSLAVYGSVMGSVTVGATSVRELPGNHRTQITTAAKPKLTARVNLFTQTENVSVAPWSTGSAITRTASAYTALDGTLAGSILETAVTAQHRLDMPQINFQPSTQYTMRFRVKPVGRGAEIYAGNTVLSNKFVRIDSSGTITATGGSYGTLDSSSSVALGSGEFEVTIVHTTATGAAAITTPTIYLVDDVGAYSYAGDITKGMYLWRPQYELGAVAGPYQRVVTATDYDAVGFPHRIKYDGFDDFLVSNVIDWMGTDKVTVWAGVTKMTDVGVQAFYESSININNNVGAFAAFPGYQGSGSSVGPYWCVVGRGATVFNAATTAAIYPAPMTAVQTQVMDIAADTLQLRINGAQVAQSTQDHGTGSLGNYPMYFGRRGGSSLPLNGEEFALVIKGKATTAAQITTGETLAASLTGVALP